MGFIFSKSMDSSMKKQQEFMALNSRLQLERQIQMQNQMRERQTAMQIAWSREFLKYFGTFYGLATLGLTAGALRRKRPGMFFPLVPLGFILVYQIDMAYGTLMQRMKGSELHFIGISSGMMRICLLVQSVRKVYEEELGTFQCQAEAEGIMVSEHDRLELPHGAPTFESIEKARRSLAHLFIEK